MVGMGCKININVIIILLYLAYIFLWQSITNKDLASKISAALAIVGFVNIPIIKFSVDWWNTLHQPATISKLSLLVLIYQ